MIHKIFEGLLQILGGFSICTKVPVIEAELPAGFKGHVLILGMLPDI